MEVLEVSVTAVSNYFMQLESIQSKNQHIFIHLGVNCGADCIYVEECAYNSMNFRVADQQGFQPVDTLISVEDGDGPLDSCVHNDIDNCDLVNSSCL